MTVVSPETVDAEGSVGRDGPAVDERVWLLEQRRALDRGEAVWLARLGDFDASGGWAADGQLSCVDWLVWFAKLGRSTAFDKLRVARQLRRRPVLAEAYRAGRLSYSALRAICRAEDASDELDAALVRVAESGTVRDLEVAVRWYRYYRDQERRPGERGPDRGVRLRRGPEGLTRLEGWLTDAEADQLGAALAALADTESSREDAGTGGDDPAGDPGGAGPAAKSSAGDWWDGFERGSRHAAARRADALMDLVERAAASLGEPAVTVDRYLAHVIVGPDGSPTLADGTPFTAPAAATATCGGSSVCHHQDGDGRPLYQGLRRRTWSVAQQRAALVRDGGHCRFPGCGRTTCHLHHLRFWNHGGPTDITNGVLLCRHHHTLIHEHAYRVDGDPTGPLHFTRPDGQLIGTTRPVARSRPARDPTGARR